MRNPALFSRIFNTPLLIQPSKLDAIIAGIGGRFGVESSLPPYSFDYAAGTITLLERSKAALTQEGYSSENGYQIIGGIAIIDIMGVLAHRGGFQADSSYVLGYDQVGKMLNAAVADPAVKAILLQLDSPGGEVSGAFELAALIKQASQTKPIKATLSSMAASAGYLLASAASEIAISETGIAGSIGVVMRHIDMSKMAEQDGVSVTYIYAGDKKIDGNPFQPLPDTVKSEFQNQIDKLYSLFVSTIATNRGMDTETIRAQQAGIYTGQDAIDAGLADRLATPDDMLADMQTSTTHPRSIYMTTSVDNAALEQHALETSRAEGFKAGQLQGSSDGAKLERDRIAAILNHAEAQGREAQAKVFALESDMTIETVGKLLAASPKVEPAKAQGNNQFADMMAKQGSHDIGPGDDDDGEGDEVKNDKQAKAGWHKAFAVYNGNKR